MNKPNAKEIEMAKKLASMEGGFEEKAGDFAQALATERKAAEEAVWEKVCALAVKVDDKSYKFGYKDGIEIKRLLRGLVKKLLTLSAKGEGK